jgi:hypothetical protein
LPRLFTLCGVAFDELPGRPFGCIFRLFRRWIFELPRISHPSAAPASKFRVAPVPRCSSAASQYRLRVAPPPVSSGCRRWIFESPRISHPFGGTGDAAPGCPFAASVSPPDESPGCPGSASSGCALSDLASHPASSFSWRRRLVEYRIAPLLAPFGLPTTGYRVAPHLHSRRLCRFCVFGFPRIPASAAGR